MSAVEDKGQDAEQLVTQLNALIGELEQYPESEVREKALDLVQLVLELYGEALRRVLLAIDPLPGKDEILTRLAGDEVLRAILLLHGLLPVELHERIAAALEELRPYFISQGCDVELLGIDDGRAQIRLIRKGSGAPPVSVLRSEIEKALGEAAPDLMGVDVEGMAQQVEATKKAVAQLSKLIPPGGNGEHASRLVQIKPKQPAHERVNGVWVPVVRALGFDDRNFKIVNYADINLLVSKIGGEFYAYRNACAEGGRPLDDALYETPMLTCSCHGYLYDLRRGVSLHNPDVRLERAPLKVEEDKVKVAI